MIIKDLNSIDNKYDTIYADPPWQYKDKLNHYKRGSIHKYSLLSLQQIKDLPIKHITKDDCFLFLWVVFPLLLDCLQVFEAWGFTYKNRAFDWVKLNKKEKSLFWGLGHYTRGNNELCLLGVKGKPKIVNKNVHSTIISPIEKHSKKPDEVNLRINNLVGEDKLKLELFARRTFKGWDSWGNEL